ncbi:uncharacterized protein LOC133331924 [Musca vetustissima]|uniref:uncharacterized protein LOC133331924 n=1 Tax=Musca vetustissima TaxID=27455 RepID=UPI002AB7D788|nr:uncharacterized protein LOC133331924 [Musca vetustissima]
MRGILAAALLLLLGAFLPLNQALLHDIHEVIDFDSANLRDFQYFKNLPSQDPKRAGQANLFLEHFQKKKAILDYVEHLFLGNSPFTKESEIPFDPHFGRAWRPYYVRKYGWRGERLIDSLGRGYSLNELRKYGAIPKEYGTKYYPN